MDSVSWSRKPKSSSFPLTLFPSPSQLCGEEHPPTSRMADASSPAGYKQFSASLISASGELQTHQRNARAKKKKKLVATMDSERI